MKRKQRNRKYAAVSFALSVFMVLGAFLPWIPGTFPVEASSGKEALSGSRTGEEAEPLASAYGSFTPNSQWMDDKETMIQAHGGRHSLGYQDAEVLLVWGAEGRR